MRGCVCVCCRGGGGPRVTNVNEEAPARVATSLERAGLALQAIIVWRQGGRRAKENMTAWLSTPDASHPHPHRTARLWQRPSQGPLSRGFANLAPFASYPYTHQRLPSSTSSNQSQRLRDMSYASIAAHNSEGGGAQPSQEWLEGSLPGSEGVQQNSVDVDSGSVSSKV